MEPIKPLRQTTPVVESQTDNFKSQSNGSTLTYVTQVYEQPTEIQIQQDADEDVFINDSVTDVVVPPVDSSGNLEVVLPDGFAFTVVNSTPSIVTASDGGQTANVDVQIPEVDGIIDYEVRLILNG